MGASTKTALLERATALGIAGRSKMTKAQLEEAITATLELQAPAPPAAGPLERDPARRRAIRVLKRTPNCSERRTLLARLRAGEEYEDEEVLRLVAGADDRRRVNALKVASDLLGLLRRVGEVEESSRQAAHLAAQLDDSDDELAKKWRAKSDSLADEARELNARHDQHAKHPSVRRATAVLVGLALVYRD